MKKASTVFLVFAAVTFLVQWLVPFTMMTGQEVVLKRGQEIKIRCQPIDPYDPFRGRYVRVRLDLSLPENLQLPEGWDRQQRVFAILGTDVEGFAEVKSIQLDEPGQGLYVRGQKLNWGNTFDLGLDRY